MRQKSVAAIMKVSQNAEIYALHRALTAKRDGTPVARRGAKEHSDGPDGPVVPRKRAP